MPRTQHEMDQLLQDLEGSGLGGALQGGGEPGEAKTDKGRKAAS